jgi:hypothetical protein
VLPWLIPRALGFYRSIKASSQGPNSAVRPPPPHVQRCLNILYACVFVSLALTFPYFAPSNIFQETKSRLLLQTNLIAHRLSALRQGNLTTLDEAILRKLEAEPDAVRLFYAAYGPDVVANCVFCKASEPSSYLYYALPSAITPHILHITLLGVITSSFFSGPEGNRWRTHATIAGVVLAAGELYLTWNYNWEANRTVRMVQDVDFFYWRMRTYRHIAFALVDALLGWALWLTSTNRWMVIPPNITQQMAAATEQLTIAYGRLSVLGNLRNTVLRDRELRNVDAEYWAREHGEMEEIEREREVVDAKNLALSRMDYDKVQHRAGLYVEQVFAAMKSTPAQAPAQGDATGPGHLHAE